MTVRFIDLFSGIGGMRLGLVQALNELGIESKCVLSCEIDNRACETYSLNFHENSKGDIRDITRIDDFDFLLAGFPCQPFSYAGKKLGFGDTRGTLFFEVERILSQYKPKGFLLENVRGLMSHDGGRTFRTIMSKLQELGYGVKYVLLNSSNFGVPQNRVRLYIVGQLGTDPVINLDSNLGATDSHEFKRNLDKTVLIGNDIKKKVVGDILEDSVDRKYLCTKKFDCMLKDVVGEDLSVLSGYRLIDYRGGNSLHSWELGTKGKCSFEEIEFMNLLIQNRRKHDFGTHQDGKKLTLEQIMTFYEYDDIFEVMGSLIEKGYLKEEDGKFNPVCGNMSFEVFKFLDPESISITLTSSDSNRLGVVQNNVVRRITPRECARLQGFPDDFVVNPIDSFAYKQLGNSVSVPVIKALMLDFFENNLNKCESILKS